MGGKGKKMIDLMVKTVGDCQRMVNKPSATKAIIDVSQESSQLVGSVKGVIHDLRVESRCAAALRHAGFEKRKLAWMNVNVSSFSIVPRTCPCDKEAVSA